MCVRTRARAHTHTHTHTLEPRKISPDAGRILKSALHRDLNSKCTMHSCFQNYFGRYAHVLKGSGRRRRALETYRAARELAFGGGLWSSLSLMKLRSVGVCGGESGGGAGFIELGRVTDVV